MSERLSENLMGERDRLIDERDKLQAENAKLKAQVERLREALKDVVKDNDIQSILDTLEMDLPVSESDGMNNYERAVFSLCDIVRRFMSIAAKAALETKEAR